MGLLPTNITAGAAGHISQTNQAHGKLNDLPNVARDYLCVGDDSTDNTTTLQAAIDETADAAATQGRGGTLVVPPGIYRTDPLTMKDGVVLWGLGHPGLSDSRYGAYLKPRANSQTILTIDPGSLDTLGFVCEGLGFMASSFTGITGLAIYGVTNWVLNRCVFAGNAGNPMATGLFTSAKDSGGTITMDNAWWNVFECSFRRCQLGADIGGNGGRITDSNFIPEAAQSGEIGVKLRRTASPDSQSQNNSIKGCMFDQSPSASVALLVQGDANMVSGNKFEGRSNTDCAIKIEDTGATNSGNRTIITGNDISQCIGAGSAAIRVGTGCDDTGIIGNIFLNNNTPEIVDNGTRTQDFHNRKSNATWT